ncbi:MAG: DNA polymerase I [Planctomycetes bacterium]|nr:DNA polymerase I [Planctomycetota bacterium]MCL4730230.1 DNA polymerase I [Planctomycetota bacterium]
MPERLYIIDGHSQIFRAYYSPAGRRSVRGVPVGAVYIFTRMLQKLIKSHKPDYLVCTLDPRGPTFRDKIYPQYKANRDEMPEDLREQMPKIEAVVRAFGIPIATAEGFEADDVIATLAKRAARQGLSVRMVSRDKDLKQLVEDDLLLLNADDDTTYGPKELKEEFGLTTDQYIDLQALAGDSVDNIPGAKGIGPKTAAELLQQYGTLENVLRHAEEIKQPKRRENLIAFRPEAELSKKLVTMRTDVPLDFSLESARLKPPEKDKLLPLLTELNFKSVINDLGWDTAGTAVAEQEPEAQAKDDSGSDSDREREVPASGKSARAGKPSGKQSSLFGAPPAAPPRTDYVLVDSPKLLKEWLGKLAKTKSFAMHCAAESPDALAGIAFALKPGEAGYVPVSADALAALKPILENPKQGKIGHDLKADARALLHKGITLHGIESDTKVDAFLLDGSREDAKLASLSREYLGQDTYNWDTLFGDAKTRGSLTKADPKAVCAYAAQYADFALQVSAAFAPQLKKLELDELARNLEMPLVEVLARMEHRGIKVDRPYLKKLGAEFEKQIAALEKECHQLAGREFNIGSPKQLGEILYDELKLPEQGKTAKGTGRSTDVEALEALASLHALPAKVLEWRHLSKLKSTYIDQLQELADNDDRVHTSYRQTVATGRLSSKDPNLQNIPVRTENGRKLRRAFIAARGMKLISADYSQIELRVLAHIADEKHMIEAFKRGADIHATTAATVFNVAEKDVSKEQRNTAKTVNYAVLYGQGAQGLSQLLGVTRAEAQSYIDNYFAGHPRVKTLRDEVLAQCVKQGFVTTLAGRKRYLPEINSRNVMLKRQAERQAFNTVLQGTAADLIKQAMLNADAEIEKKGLSYRMLLQVHDELVFEAPEKEARACAEFVQRVMGGAMKLKVPLTVDAGIGDNWLEAK